MKTADNLKGFAIQRMWDAPRCHARAKSTGERCRCPAVRGWRVCYVHGAGGGAPCGEKHGRWAGGHRSREADVLRGMVRSLVLMARDAGTLIDEGGNDWLRAKVDPPR